MWTRRQKKEKVTTIYLLKNKSCKFWQFGFPLLVMGSEPKHIAIKYSGRVEIKAAPRPGTTNHKLILGPEIRTRKGSKNES